MNDAEILRIERINLKDVGGDKHVPKDKDVADGKDVTDDKDVADDYKDVTDDYKDVTDDKDAADDYKHSAYYKDAFTSVAQKFDASKSVALPKNVPDSIKKMNDNSLLSSAFASL